MSSSPENFDQLRKLLTVKRHEQPPPGYFNHFSDKVVARIEVEGLKMRVSWWQRLFPELDAKPVLACAYGLVMMGLLAVGIGVSQSLDTQEASAPNPRNPWLAQTPTQISALPVGASLAQPLPGQNNSSVNAVIDNSGAPSFLFDVNRLEVKPASWNLR